MADRRGGRPPLQAGDPSVSVHLRVPSSQYDAAYQRAQRDRMTVPEVIRREWAAASQPDDGDENDD